MTATTAQLNVRMSKSVRDEGSRALQSKGYSAADFIRAAWRKAARRGPELDELVRAVEDDSGKYATSNLQSREESASVTKTPTCNADDLWQGLVDYLGSGTTPVARGADNRPYRELLEAALCEEETL